MSSGLGGGEDEFAMFDTVTRDQFGAVVLGFLTYRLPLFFGQIRDAFKMIDAENTDSALVESGSGIQLQGSAGVAAKLLSRRTTSGSDGAESSAASAAEDRLTVLLVSGPQATGRSELVQRLLELKSDD